jgi:hypothetical protein
MNNENSDAPATSQALESSRREFQHLWTRRAAALDTVRRTGGPHVPQITSYDTRCQLVGLHPPAKSEGSSDHEGAKVVIYIPDNGRDPKVGSEPPV